MTIGNVDSKRNVLSREVPMVFDAYAQPRPISRVHRADDAVLVGSDGGDGHAEGRAPLALLRTSPVLAACDDKRRDRNAKRNERDYERCKGHGQVQA